MCLIAHVFFFKVSLDNKYNQQRDILVVKENVINESIIIIILGYIHVFTLTRYTSHPQEGQIQVSCISNLGQ